MSNDKAIVLEKTHYVYVQAEGEVCNRLRRGTAVMPVGQNRNGEWLKITWRNGKKKGWIKLSANEVG
jgi:hypothetical protein